MRPVLQPPIIYLITKGAATDSNFPDASREILDIVRVATDCQVSMIQIREKRLCARLLFHLTVAAVEITRGTATRLLVNGRADIAFAAEADGVHLAADAIPVAVVRGNFPPEFAVGVSSHTPEAARNAKNAGADFAVFGPIFGSPGKGKPKGLASLSNVCRNLRPFPVLGLGGINATNVGSVNEAGAAGIAAIRSLNDNGSLRAICHKLR